MWDNMELQLCRYGPKGSGRYRLKKGKLEVRIGVTEVQDQAGVPCVSF